MRLKSENFIFMIRLLEVATARLCRSDSCCLEISVDKKLGELSLKGVSEWSHIWIVFVDETGDQTAQCMLAELICCKSRNLTVKISQEWLPSFRIVDLKPYHFLEFFPDA